MEAIPTLKKQEELYKEKEMYKGLYEEWDNKIKSLTKELEEANQRLEKARDLLSPIFEDEGVPLGLRTQVGSAMILLSTPPQPKEI